MKNFLLGKHSGKAVLVALLLLLPLGLLWMWRGKVWSRTTRWAVTSVTVVLLIASSVSSAPPTPSNTNQAALLSSRGSQSASPAVSERPSAASPSLAPPSAVPTAPRSAPTPTPSPAVGIASSPSPAAKAPTSVAPPTPVTQAPSLMPSKAVAVASPVPPKPAPAVAPKIATDLCGAPANPYGYNYCGRGSTITDPAADICNYFSCIPNFSAGVGFMVQCNDKMVSMSGGRRGVCSHHGGNLRPVTG